MRAVPSERSREGGNPRLSRFHRTPRRGSGWGAVGGAARAGPALSCVPTELLAPRVRSPPSLRPRRVHLQRRRHQHKSARPQTHARRKSQGSVQTLPSLAGRCADPFLERRPTG
ncbi:hypothetical protein AAFF_G00214210 [Aldrovandia affinis]|uniref:Uncharacterized protein n=1 Tax=Aldrovandia affinis TaxID=143900 RepID=A0AAD7RGF9_9TELE|nr:hypothetical protein AAFF_G00214210 [Aldrovandia affinis]